MRLKSAAPRRPILPRGLREYFSGRPSLLRGLLQSGLITLAFGAGMLAYRQQWHRPVRSLVSANLRLVPHIVQGLLARPQRLSLDIAHTDYLALARQRDEALAQGFLLLDDEDYVPAELSVAGQKTPIKLRLKGDHIDHLEGQKWSFRVQAKGDNTILGMKQLSLHHPRTRSYAYEWLYQRLLASEDVIALRYGFVDLTLNGRHLGIYALEEHFEKRLIEHSQRREGPILRFDESLFWQELLADEAFAGEGRQWSGVASYFASGIDGFQTGATLDDPVLARQYALAAGLLEGFRRGELATHQVFDLERTASFFAISDLLGAEHGTRWHNLRFYYNPVTARLEPIGFDGFETTGWTGWQDSGLPPPATTLSGIHLLDAEAWGHNARLFADPLFFAAYERALERVADPAWFDVRMDALRPALREEMAILYREFPYYRFSEDLIRQNAAFVRASLDPPEPLRAYLAPAGPAGVVLEVGNIQNLPLEVLGVSRDGKTVHALETPLLLAGRRGTVAVDYQRFGLPLALSLDAGQDPAAVPDTGAESASEVVVTGPASIDGLQADYRILGSEQTRQAAIIPLPRYDAALLDPAALRDTPNAADFGFLIIDEPAKRIEIPPGSWAITRSLILPAGYTVTAEGRVALDLRDGAMILSRSPLRFQGDPEAPIRIGSSDGSGQGLLILEAGAESQLTDVVLHNLTAPQQPGWALTGAVTAYDSPIHLTRVAFESARSEDALNIMRTDFVLEDCRFADSASDALDVDFGQGRILRTRFLRSGNDAVDISGSQLEVDGLEIDGFGDKGLSVGENSQLEGSSIRIRSGEIGVAAKDRSTARLQGLRMEGARVGLTAFQKKPEFGPAQIDVEGLEIIDAVEAYLLEEGSSIRVDGQERPANADTLESLFYGVKFGKASR
jgi:hypothetical protein